VFPFVLLHLILVQAPAIRSPVAVVITSKRPGAEAVSPKIAQRIFDSFKREGVTGLLDDSASASELKTAGFSDPKSCEGAKSCLQQLATLLGSKAVVVGVDVGKIGKTLAIHLEAVSADGHDALGSLDVSSSLNGWSDAMSAPIVVFVRDVKAGLEVKPVVATQDAPRKTALLPPPPKAAPLVVSQSVRPMKAAPWILVGGAAVTAGTAVALGAMSGTAKQQFQGSLVTLADGSTGSRLAETDARALASTANTEATLALGSAIVSAACVAAAVVLFLKD
jgi:hypothetical protein